jgi:undecaprenyl-diphosphatase
MNIDWIVTGKATILGLVQGLTELLPVSSTGHLILAERWMDVTDEKWKAFDVFVHMGTLLAICAAYYRRLDQSAAGLLRGDRKEWRFWILIGIAAVPALAAGAAFNKYADDYLRKPVPVACALILGALAIFVIEHWYRQRQARGIEAAVKDMEEVTPLQAVKIGCVQVLALIPGVSRSGSTIMGGMTFGVSRTAATDFTFFLAMPVLVAAAGHDLLKYRHCLSAADAIPFTAGFLVAFFSALLVVKWLLRFIATHDFRPFAWYRLVLGAAVLAECLLRGHG